MSHDSSYKKFFSRVDMVESLVRDFISKDLADELDFKTLKLMPTVFQKHGQTERRGDLIWRLKWRDGNPCLLAILLEFQSTIDKKMLCRLMEYATLFLEQTLDDDKNKGLTLPQILPIVLYNGAKPWSAPRVYGELSERERLAYERGIWDFKYHLIDIRHLEESLVDKAKGISAWIFRFERAANVQEMERLWRVMFRALKNPAYENLRQEIIIWLETCVLPVRKIAGAKIVVKRLKEEEKMTVVTAEMEDWTLPYINQGIRQGRTEGEARGRAEGRLEGKLEGERIGELRGRTEGIAEKAAQVIRQMIAEGFEDNLIARLVSVPLSEVKKLRIASRRDGG